MRPSCGSVLIAIPAQLSAQHEPAALGGGEGWGEVGDSRAPADTHLTLPSLRDGSLPLPPEGRRGKQPRASLGGLRAAALPLTLRVSTISGDLPCGSVFTCLISDRRRAPRRSAAPRSRPRS